MSSSKPKHYKIEQQESLPSQPPTQEKCCEKCYGRQGTSAGGGIFCFDSDCPCHNKKCCETCKKRKPVFSRWFDYLGGNCDNKDCPCHKQPQCIHGHSEEEIKHYGCETNEKYHGRTVTKQPHTWEEEFDAFFPQAAMEDMQRAYMRNIKEWVNKYLISKKELKERERGQLIYCEIDGFQPVLIEDPRLDAPEKKVFSDVMCSKCHLVIGTVSYDIKPEALNDLLKELDLTDK